MDAAVAAFEAATPEQGREALDYVLAHLDMARADVLLVSSMAALQFERLEDAGFLFYAGQLRSRFDRQRFPPVGTGGNDPGVALAALQQVIGGELNPAIMRQPVVFAAALKRIESWDLDTGPGYEPGWQFAGGLSSSEAKSMAEKLKAEYLETGNGIATLLKTPEYFAAFLIVQEANLGTFSGPGERQAAQERALQAQQKMREIEEKLQIEGMFYQKPK